MIMFPLVAHQTRKLFPGNYYFLKSPDINFQELIQPSRTCLPLNLKKHRDPKWGKHAPFEPAFGGIMPNKAKS